MKKFYYFLALIGIVACTTDPIDVFTGEIVDGSDPNTAVITYTTGVDSSLESKLIQYFGEAYADRSSLKVILSGSMDTEDFKDLKGLTVLDMSGVTLVDSLIPSEAFVGCSLDTLTLPTTGTVKYINDKAFVGTNLSSLSFPSEVLSFGADLFDAGNTSLTTLVITCDEQATVTDSSFPELFTNAYYDSMSDLDSYLAGTIIRPSIEVPSGTLYLYRQDDTWALYNMEETLTGFNDGYYTVVVYSGSALATTETEEIAALEGEIISVVGDEYLEMTNLDLVIKGTLIEADFDLFADAMFRSIDMSEVTIVGDILVEESDDILEPDLDWDGNAIPSSAFNRNSYLQSIIFPPAIEAFGKTSFFYCTSLSSISFPYGTTGSVTHIARQAFSQCTSLKTVEFLDGCPLKTLTEYAFGGCTSIEGISIPATVDSLGYYIINASDVCNYVLVNWTEAENIPSVYEDAPAFPTQFFKGEDMFITIPDGTREEYEKAGWGFFNLCENSEVVMPKEWVTTYRLDFDVNETASDLTEENWTFEKGFVRNYESQYYTADSKNVYKEDGKLVIKAIKEEVTNEFYVANSSVWTEAAATGEYTSASVMTNYSFYFGRVKVCAKVPTISCGGWPSITMYGISTEAWPLNGQVDIASYFSGQLYHRFGWGYTTTSAFWNSAKTTFISDEEREAYANEYHTWLYEWDEDQCSIYVYGDETDEFGNFTDSTLLNTVDLSYTANLVGNKVNPFKWKYQSIKFNLALGASGGDINDENLPQMEIDYVEFMQYEWQFR